MTSAQQKWHEVGKVFELSLRERSKEQQGLTKTGLCRAVNQQSIPYSALDPLTSENLLLERLASCETYWLPVRDSRCYTNAQQAVSTSPTAKFTKEHDYIRATFAYLMSHLTDEERAEL